MPLHKAWLLLLLPFAPLPAHGASVSSDGRAIKPFPLGGHHAAAVRRGRLVAWDTRTGRRLWAFGDGLGEGPFRDDDGQWEPEEGLVFAAHGRVFTTSHLGRLYAVSARSGRLLWSTATRLPVNVTRNKSGVWKNFGLRAMDGDADTLAADWGRGVIVYDAATGRERWRAVLPPEEETGSENVNLTPSLLLLGRWTEGAGMSTETDAYNRQTGKPLWTVNGDFDPQKSRGQHLEVAYYNLGQMGDQTHPWLRHHQVVDEQTGKVLKEYVAE